MRCVRDTLKKTSGQRIDAGFRQKSPARRANTIYSVKHEFLICPGRQIRVRKSLFID
jgi:hypothetical protein